MTKPDGERIERLPAYITSVAASGLSSFANCRLIVEWFKICLSHLSTKPFSGIHHKSTSSRTLDQLLPRLSKSMKLMVSSA